MILNVDWLEYFGVITGLLYLFLEIRQHKAMWVVGFLTSLVYVFVFFHSKIYADMGLQVYYVAISLYGFVQWNLAKKKVITADHETGKSPGQIIYRHLNLRLAVGIGTVLLATFGIVWYALSQYTDSPIPVGDAFTTAVGIVATWMLAKRIIEHWAFWIVVNLVSVYLYQQRELYPTMFLYLCYALLAIVGYYNWIKKGKKEKTCDL